MTAVNASTAVVATAVAGWIFYRGWFQGKGNIGPRVGAVAILAAGTAVASVLSIWATTVTGFVAGLVSTVVSGIGTGGVSGLAPVLSFALVNLPWLAAMCLGALWVAALLPDRVSKEHMSWGLAWAGGLIPPLLVTAPGPVQAVLGAVVSTSSNVVSAVAAGVMRAGAGG